MDYSYYFENLVSVDPDKEEDEDEEKEAEELIVSSPDVSSESIEPKEEDDILGLMDLMEAPPNENITR